MFRLFTRLNGADDGMTTVEYAMGTVAAAGFALVLIKIVNSPGVSQALTRVITEALN
ncbi:DUF4244 domain-containing protein [Actinoplanes sp. NPDC051494]|uniref:DUF4244 domain-containing protein n=1 Tax=Actinoplanes sp. NPDC051494 TaxID=3363907 RepID=UPI0037B457FD